MSLILQTALTGLLLPNPTYTLANGTTAQLSRYEYINPYINQVNFQQYVPIIFFNVITGDLQMSNTPDINFISTDLFNATDWTILNQTIYYFTAIISEGSNIIIQATTPLANTGVHVPLAPGQYISGYGIPNGTTIVSGSLGTYIISNNATVTIITPTTLGMTLI